MIHFKHKPAEKYTLVAYKIEDGILTPSDLVNLSPPDPVANNFAHKGIVLSGRGPLWLYGFLVHLHHPTKWVATYDPRLEGSVVVASHDPKTKIWDLIPLSNDEL